ncbi:DUF397 domain-containing protein [Streptomyces sp. DG1A-41]|uniref:DUF397 domain-containing protein n=1 Tax=Streptomyces sp. DG1A-41 TaxID=3125779 RepID=UPI0030CFF214
MSNTRPGESWVKSTYSGGEGGQCLEWLPTQAAASGVVPVRDSKAPGGPILTFPAAQWNSFVHYASGREV